MRRNLSYKYENCFWCCAVYSSIFVFGHKNIKYFCSVRAPQTAVFLCLESIFFSYCKSFPNSKAKMLVCFNNCIDMKENGELTEH